MMNEVSNEVSNEVCNEVCNEVNNEVSNEISNEVSNEVCNEVSNDDNIDVLDQDDFVFEYNMMHVARMTDKEIHNLIQTVHENSPDYNFRFESNLWQFNYDENEPLYHYSFGDYGGRVKNWVLDNKECDPMHIHCALFCDTEFYECEFNNVIFVNCNMCGCDFRQSTLKNVTLIKCLLDENSMLSNAVQIECAMETQSQPDENDEYKSYDAYDCDEM